MMRYNSHNNLQTVTRAAIVGAFLSLLVCCIREPELHLFDGGEIDIDLPLVELELDAYWDYEVSYGVHYDWRAEWYYGWDAVDYEIFGEIGYTIPNTFHLRRYFTGSVPLANHTSVVANTVTGNSFNGHYSWGFWDILVWNDVNTIDGVQSLNFDEQTSLDYVLAYTNQTMNPSYYQAPRYTHSFNQPEDLFAAYDHSIEINRDLRGFVYDPENNEYVLRLNMTLEPITYIYLTQVILHHNRNRIVGVDGQANLSGFGRSTNVNTGTADMDPVTVYYNTRFKNNCNKNGETVDIVGGRIMTFGICGMNANRAKHREEVRDEQSHFLDLTMQFNNGMDSTFVFDVTEQVRNRWKGGVITVELDMDTVPVPSRSGGSAFDAVVKDFEDGGTHEFDL
jgi:hypothetical protein